jgi:hypothetical protein
VVACSHDRLPRVRQEARILVHGGMVGAIRHRAAPVLLDPNGVHGCRLVHFIYEMMAWEMRKGAREESGREWRGCGEGRAGEGGRQESMLSMLSGTRTVGF